MHNLHHQMAKSNYGVCVLHSEWSIGFQKFWFGKEDEIISREITKQHTVIPLDAFPQIDRHFASPQGSAELSGFYFDPRQELLWLYCEGRSSNWVTLITS